MGFDNMSFAKLPYFYRNLIKESHEGKAHIAAGGRFVKLDENGAMIIDDGSDNYTTAPLGKLTMINNQFTYEQLKSGGWSDQAMIDNGYARREAVQTAAPIPVPIPTPIPQVQYQTPVQQIPQIQPQAPMSIQPQMPLAHTNPTQPMLTMLDKSATYQDFINNGWTDALLIEHKKAIMMPAANTVFPPAQTTVAPPPGVQIPQAQTMPNAIPIPQPSAANMFQQATAAPVQQMGIPQAPIPTPPISAFEQPSTFNGEAPPDDLPF
jgi:hypothetical protein